MKLLALESSRELLTVALSFDGRIVERQSLHDLSHSETALPLVRPA
ncbi:MAG: hypothetical protein IPO57_13395 [Rhodocyclales bacterium]|nr:hypothetical protein [Rhodocyclales bacterium]